MEEVIAALDNAKWKEIVSVQAQEHQPVNLVAYLDTENGGLRWNQIPDEQVVRRHLEAKQWIMPMLNDARRNQLYYEAIKAALNKLQADGEDNDDEPLHILDLGCGTGLLGMMAAQLCASDKVRITSVDMSMVMVQVATQTVTDNQLADRITLLEGHSTEMLPFRANLCVSELLEDGLLGEGWLPAIRDVWKRHLNLNAPNAKPPIVIPSGATVYAQLIQGEWLRDYVGPRPYKTHNGTLLHLSPANDPFLVPTAVIPMHVGHLIEQGRIIPLSNPVELFSFDVSQADRVPDSSGRQIERTITSTVPGTVHAILVTWDLELFPGIAYSLYDPDDADATIRQDHWHTCVHVLESSFETTANHTWTIQGRHDDYNMQVSLVPAEVSEQPAVKRERRDSPDPIHTYHSPARVFQMNHIRRRQALGHGVKDALQQDKPSPTVVLDVSDFCFGALLAAGQEGISNVMSVERIEAQAAVRAIQANGLQKNIQVLQGYFRQIDEEALLSSDADAETQKSLLVVAEPSYTQLHYWPHLEAFQLYYVIRGLSRRLGSTWDVYSTPRHARILAAAFRAPELAQAYGPCDSLKRTYNWDHEYVNQQNYDDANNDREISISLWQYEYDLLTDAFEVATLPFDGTALTVTTETKPFIKTGMCDGVVVWVAYDFSDGNTYSNAPDVLGTRQAVYLWRDGVDIEELNKGIQLREEINLEHAKILGFHVV